MKELIINPVTLKKGGEEVPIHGITNTDKVEDVQINGASIVDDGVANIPKLDGYNKYGLPKLFAGTGFQISSADGNMYVARATEAQIDERKHNYNPITPANLEYAVKSVVDKPWVLKGALTTENKGEGVQVDLSGCSELIIKGDITATNGSNIQAHHKSSVDNIISSGASTGDRWIFYYGKSMLGYTVGISASYGGRINANYTGASLPNNVFIDDVHTVTKIRFGTPTNITSCNIEIYAR